jgi:hypothetical protein
VNYLWAAFATTGIVLAAAYMLWLYQRVMLGAVENPKNMALPDLTLRELTTLVPIVVLCFWIGLYPSPFLRRIVGSRIAQKTSKILERCRTGIGSGGSPLEILEGGPWTSGQVFALRDRHGGKPGDVRVNACRRRATRRVADAGENPPRTLGNTDLDEEPVWPGPSEHRRRKPIRIRLTVALVVHDLGSIKERPDRTAGPDPEGQRPVLIAMDDRLGKSASIRVWPKHGVERDVPKSRNLGKRTPPHRSLLALKRRSEVALPIKVLFGRQLLSEAALPLVIERSNDHEPVNKTQVAKLTLRGVRITGPHLRAREQHPRVRARWSGNPGVGCTTSEQLKRERRGGLIKVSKELKERYHRRCASPLLHDAKRAVALNSIIRILCGEAARDTRCQRQSRQC